MVSICSCRCSAMTSPSTRFSLSSCLGASDEAFFASFFGGMTLQVGVHQRSCDIEITRTACMDAAQVKITNKSRTRDISPVCWVKWHKLRAFLRSNSSQVSCRIICKLTERFISVTVLFVATLLPAFSVTVQQSVHALSRMTRSF